ncbi:MAG: hypothetical protein AAFX06_24075 [Planctomycetota bacterium]
MVRVAFSLLFIGALSALSQVSGGVIATTRTTHSLTLDSVTGVSPTDYVVSSELAFVGGGVLDLFAAGEGATDASGTVSVNGLNVTNPFEVPDLVEGDTFAADLTAVAERSSAGFSEADAFAAYQMTFENASASAATFTLTYSTMVSASVTGAETLFNSSEGISDSFAMLADDGDIVGAPFVNAAFGPFTIKSLSDERLIESRFDGNGSSSGTMTETFSFTVAAGTYETFTIEAFAGAQAMATVPEPGSLIVWSAGLLLVTRRRRKS